MERNRALAQSTIEYALLAVAIALSAIVFFRNFDRIQGIFKNHVKEAAGVMADSRVPPLLVYAGGRAGYPYLNMGYHYGIFNSSKETYLADTSTVTSRVKVPKWKPQPVNPLIAPYMAMVYSYAQQYLNQAVARGDISASVAQQANQALEGYLNVPKGYNAQAYLSSQFPSWLQSYLNKPAGSSGSGSSNTLKAVIAQAFAMWGKLGASDTKTK